MMVSKWRLQGNPEFSGAMCEISDPRTQMILRVFPDILFRIDAHGQYLECFTHSPELVATAPDNIVGRSVFEILPGNIAEMCVCSIQQALVTGEVQHIEYALELDDGVHHFESRHVALNDSEVIAVVRDVSLQKRSEELLRKTEHYYRTLLEHASDAIFITTSDGRFVTVNRQGCKLLKKTEQDLVQMHVYDVLSHTHHSRIQHILEQAQAQKNVRVDFTYTDAHQQVHYLEVNATRMPNSRVQAIVRDYTQRQHAHDALRKSEKWFRLLIEQSSSLIFVSRNGQVVWANPAALSGLRTTAQRLIGRDLYLSVHPDDRLEVLTRIEQQSHTGRMSPLVEQRLLRDDETVMWVELTAISLEFDGEPSNIVIAHDITRRKKAEEDRQRLERRIQHGQKLQSLGVLAGGIAHDFNNLLTGVLGNASLALMDLPFSSPVRQYVQDIELAARRAAELTHQLLAYSGKSCLVSQPVCLSKAVREMVQLLKTVISKRAELHIECAEQLPMIDADEVQIRQIIMNLITNASDALEDQQGTITIRTLLRDLHDDYLTNSFFGEKLRPGPYVVLEVVDSGIGMDAATIDKMFDPFFTTKASGHGLGLATVIGIVRAHRGAIHVYSEPAEGTCFKVIFPPSSKTVAASQNDNDVGGWKGHGTVLLIDDDMTVRGMICQVLEKKGFSVLAVSDGQQVLQIYNDSSLAISLVILDLTLPQMKAQDTVQILRSIKPSVPILLTSGYPEKSVLKHLASGLFSGFIQKPFGSSELLHKVAQALQISSISDIPNVK